MTKKELIEQLADVPDDAVICTLAPYENVHAEVTSISYMEDETYYDKDDKLVNGNIVEL